MVSTSFFLNFFLILNSAIILAGCDSSFIADEEVKDCTRPGPFCESCSTLVYCIKLGPDDWMKQGATPCGPGKKCVYDNCTADSDPICDGLVDLDFPCQQVGVFPNPFYCNQYVICIQEGPKAIEGYPVTCDDGFAYDITSENCDIPLENNECPVEYPVPVCKTAGQSEALLQNKRYFYICQAYSLTDDVLYPKLYKCPEGTSYQDYECK